MNRRRACSATVVALLVLVPSLLAEPQDKAASQVKTLRIGGLTEPVEVIRDRWGINHIYAKNEKDLFFAQGYTAAKDRLFQFEIWRRQATGTVAEILGPSEVKRDTGARLHKFRGDMKTELAWYHPRGEEIVTAYLAGVNAYVDEVNRTPALMPLELKMLGVTPQHWTPDAIVSRFNGLLANIGQELNVGMAVHLLGPEKVKSLIYFQGGDPDITPAAGADFSVLTKDILDLYNAFREPIQFRPEAVVAEYRNPHPAARNADASAGPSAEDLFRRQEDIGSNNWVVSGRLTQTTLPMMMNDPHRVQGAPSLRYWVHLVAPGWNVIGGGEPMLPGVSIGHNEYGAWGLTVFGNDSEDLYVYDTNPANPNQYKHLGQWEDMRIVKETIPVKGQSPVAVELKYTRHGPVLFEDKAHQKAYALRAAWLDYGGAPYLASLRMDQARSWQEFREACEYSRIPAENMVWADREGNIGYQAVGVAPLRPNFSGLIPVPGDGRYEWAGYLPIKALPSLLNPAEGFFATANHYLFPNDYPYKEALHYTWTDPYRASAIREFLGSGRIMNVADMKQLQNDNLSIPARSLVPLLKDLPVQDPVARKAQGLLLGWNYRTDADSVPAGIYEMWLRRLNLNVRDALIPKPAQAFLASIAMKRVVDLLNAPDGRLGTTQARDELLLKSLNEAVAELAAKLGPDMANWQWGQEKYHHATIVHPLAQAVKPELVEKLNVGRLPRGGDAFTVSATGGGDNQTSGGSFKIIADTENWDNSVGLNNPGQSGDPDSPHYRDLYELWARGKYFTVAYSRPVVESVAEERLMLQPATLSGPSAGGR